MNKMDNQIIEKSSTLGLDENLPTYEEYLEKIERVKATKIGRLFTILKEERKRILIALATYFVCTFMYSFVRQFKDVILYDVFTGPELVNYFELCTFFLSLGLFKVSTSLSNKYGVNRFTDIYLFGAIVIYAICGIFMVFDRFVLVNKRGAVEELFNGNLAIFRGLSLYAKLFKLFSNFIYSFFYVFLDASSSLLMSCTFMTFFISNITYEQSQRYLFIILAGANTALFASVFAVRSLVGVINCSATTSTQWKYYLIFVTLLIFLYLLIVFFKRLLQNELQKPLYVGNYIKETKKKRERNTTTFSESIYVIYKVRWLFSITILALFYNVLSGIVNVSTFYSYTANSDFLTNNPKYNTTPGFNPTRSNVSMFYRTNECMITSMINIILMLLPIFKHLFHVFGIKSFGMIMVVCPVTIFVVVSIFAAINYPFTNSGQRVLMGLGIYAAENKFGQESALVCFLNIATKVAKFSFYDIIKESISSKIDPTNKVFYKGIFDGIIPKVGKLLGTFYLVLMSIITGRDDVRYFTMISSLFLIAMGVLGVISSFWLHKAYVKAVENKEFLESYDKKGEEKVEFDNKQSL